MNQIFQIQSKAIADLCQIIQSLRAKALSLDFLLELVLALAASDRPHLERLISSKIQQELALSAVQRIFSVFNPSTKKQTTQSQQPLGKTQPHPTQTIKQNPKSKESSSQNQGQTTIFGRFSNMFKKPSQVVLQNNAFKYNPQTGTYHFEGSQDQPQETVKLPPKRDQIRKQKKSQVSQEKEGIESLMEATDMRKPRRKEREQKKKQSEQIQPILNALPAEQSRVVQIITELVKALGRRESQKENVQSSQTVFNDEQIVRLLCQLQKKQSKVVIQQEKFQIAKVSWTEFKLDDNLLDSLKKRMGQIQLSQAQPNQQKQVQQLKLQNETLRMQLCRLQAEMNKKVQSKREEASDSQTTVLQEMSQLRQTLQEAQQDIQSYQKQLEQANIALERKSKLIQEIKERSGLQRQLMQQQLQRAKLTLLQETERANQMQSLASQLESELELLQLEVQRLKDHQNSFHSLPLFEPQEELLAYTCRNLSGHRRILTKGNQLSHLLLTQRQQASTQLTQSLQLSLQASSYNQQFLKEQNEQLIKQLRQACQQRDWSRERLSVLREQRKQMQGQLQEGKREVSGLRAERQQFRELKRANSRKDNQCKVQISYLKSENDYLRKKLETAADLHSFKELELHNEQLQERTLLLGKEKALLEVKLKETSQEFKKLKTQFEKERRKRKEFQKSNEQLVGIIQHLEASLDSLNSRNQELQINNSRLHEAREILQFQLQKEEKAKKRAQANLAVKQEKLRQLKCSKLQADNKLIKLSAQASSHLKQNEQLRCQITRMAGSAEQLQELLLNAQNALRLKTSQLDSLTQEVASLRSIKEKSLKKECQLQNELQLRERMSAELEAVIIQQENGRKEVEERLDELVISNQLQRKTQVKKQRELEAALQQQIRRCNNLQKQILLLQTQKNNLETLSEARRIERLELHQTQKNNLLQLHELQKKSLQTINSELAQTVEQFRLQVGLHQTMQVCCSSQVRVETSLDLHQSQLNQINKTYQSSIQTLRQQNLSLQENHQVLLKQLSIQSQELQTLQTSTKSLEKILVDQQCQLQLLQKARDAILQQNKELKTLLQEKEKQERQEDEQKQETPENRQNIENQLLILASKLAQREQAIRSLTLNFNNQEQTISSIRKQLASTHQTIQQLQNDKRRLLRLANRVTDFQVKDSQAQNIQGNSLFRGLANIFLTEKQVGSKELRQ